MVGTASRLLLLFVVVSACAVDGRGHEGTTTAAATVIPTITTDAPTMLTEALPDGCEASLCPANPPPRSLVSVCVFGRLQLGGPAFVVPLNPKSSSTTIRNGFEKHGPKGLTFEALCGLYEPLPLAIAKRLNVTGWSEIALAVVLREPMSRFVSAWNEITLRASMHVLQRQRPAYTITNGFMWMHNDVKYTMMKRGGKTRTPDKSALEVLRTPEYFRRFQKRYLQFVESLNAPISWDQDIHLAPQAVLMGVCSPQPPRARVLIRTERLQDEMPEFLSKYAGATEAHDKALLDYFRKPPQERKSISPDLLDVKKLREENAGHAALWRRIRGSINMRADYLCTGYPAPPATSIPASGSAPLINNSAMITNSSNSSISNNTRPRRSSRRHRPIPG